MASEKQLKQWIRSRLHKMQDKKLKQEEREYYMDTLAKTTSKKFEDIIRESSKGNIILRNKKGHKQELEHLWNILKKEKTPSKLTKRAIVRMQEKKLLESTFDYLYKHFTDSEAKEFLNSSHIGREENGQFVTNNYDELLHWQERHTLAETQEMIDKIEGEVNSDKSLFDEW